MEKKESGVKRKGCLFISVITLAVLLFSFLIILYLRYDAWFGNMEEEPYFATQAIDRVTLTPEEDFMRERTISWRHDTVVHVAKVEYFRVDSLLIEPRIIVLPASGQVIASHAGRACYYHTRLTGLDHGAEYKYRIVSGDQMTDWEVFTMPSGDRLRFLYIGDVQDEHGVAGDSLFSMLRGQDLEYDFLAFGGDQIERPMDKYWNIWYNSIKEWPKRVPLITVAGNHEYLKGLACQLDSRWVAQHNYPANGPVDFHGQSYYIDFPLMRMIIIDSNVIQWPNGIWQHYDWLEETLKDAAQPWKVVMFHHAVYPVRTSRMHPFMKHLFLPLLREYDVDLVLQGHDHAYSRITTKADEDTIPPVFVISNASPKFYRNGFAPVHDRLGSGIYLYQKIEITRDTLIYKSLFFNNEVYDDLVIEHLPDGRKKVIDNARGRDEIFLFDRFEDSKSGRRKRDAYLREVNERKKNLMKDTYLSNN